MSKSETRYNFSFKEEQETLLRWNHQLRSNPLSDTFPDNFWDRIRCPHGHCHGTAQHPKQDTLFILISLTTCPGLFNSQILDSCEQSLSWSPCGLWEASPEPSPQQAFSNNLKSTGKNNRWRWGWGKKGITIFVFLFLTYFTLYNRL